MAEAGESRWSALVRKVRAMAADGSDAALARKMAGAAFLIRVGSAGLAYLSQIILARWMGGHEYGVYVYVFTWVLVIGGVASLGLPATAQRFLPEYAEQGRDDLLRGYLVEGRILAYALGGIWAAVGAGLVWLFREHLSDYTVIPLVLAALCVPLHVMSDMEDCVSRSYNWIDLALMPPYILRPVLILSFMGLAVLMGYAPTAVTAMIAAVAALWVAGVLQLILVVRRLRRHITPGPRTAARREWLAVSVPIVLVEGFYLLLTHCDILVLEHFRDPEEVAVYFAAVKTLALVAFVYFSVSAAVAHRFTQYHVSGRKEELAAFLAQAIRWTFWPSLAATALLLALGIPFLKLFGASYTAGYPAMWVLAIGLLARAAVGPVERLLNMLGEQRVCAMIYGFAFVLNLVLAVILIPRYGMMGAAAATASALTAESILLFFVTRSRLGLHVFVFGGGDQG